MSGVKQARRSRPAQRWPDIMVGAVTLALLAGFGTLLFGERNRPTLAQTPPAQPITPVIPSSPGTVPEPQPVTPATPAVPDTATTAPPADTVSSTPPATTPETPATSQALDPANSATAPTQTTPAAPETAQSSTAQPTTEPSTTRPEVAQTSEIPPVPQAPPVEAIKPPVLPQPTTTQPTATATAPAQPVLTTPADTATSETTTPASPAVPARSGGAVATSENRVPLRSDYRISLGSFTTRKTVESQTANVRGLGYTVHAIDLGDQYVAQIGPFASEEAARQALADIQRAYPGALLYRPRNASAESTSGSTASQSATTSPAPSSPAPSSAQTSTETTPAPRQAAAPSGPAYLQVGAFDREESAQRLVGILHDNGFNPTVNSPEGRKTTVMVGPYSGDALLRAEARLNNAGLDYFRVR